MCGMVCGAVAMQCSGTPGSHDVCVCAPSNASPFQRVRETSVCHCPGMGTIVIYDMKSFIGAVCHPQRDAQDHRVTLPAGRARRVQVWGSACVTASLRRAMLVNGSTCLPG